MGNEVTLRLKNRRGETRTHDLTGLKYYPIMYTFSITYLWINVLFFV